MCITNPLKISGFQGNLLHMLLFSQKHAFYFSILRIKEGLSHVQQPLQQKTLRGFCYVVGVDACIDPQADDEHPPLRINS